MTRLLFTISFFITLNAAMAAPVPTGSEPPKDRDGYPLPNGATARLGSLAFRGSRLMSLEFSRDNRTIATINNMGVVTWDCKSGRILPQPPAFSPQILTDRVTAGNRIVTMTQEKLVPGASDSPPSVMVVTNRETGKVISRIPYDGTARFIFENYYPMRQPSATVSRDGRVLALVSQVRKSVEVYDTDTGKKLHSQAVDPKDGVSLISPDGETLYVYAATSAVRRYELATGKALADLEGTDRYTNWLEFSPDSKLVVSRSRRPLKDPAGKVIDDEDFLLIHDPVANKMLGRLALDGHAQMFSFAGPDALIVASGRYRETTPFVSKLSRWSVGTRKREWEVFLSLPVLRMAISPDGTRAAILSRDVVEIFDTATGSLSRNNPGTTRGSVGLGFRPTEKP